MNDNSTSLSLKEQISGKAKELGFIKTGFVQIKPLEDEIEKMKRWLDENFCGEMHWMKNNLEKRKNPTEILPEAKTIISLAYNYYTPFIQKESNPKISRYAWGYDYHYLIKDKLKMLCEYITDICDKDNFEYRYYVDNGPVMEKIWALKSGIGWIGKNSLIINPDYGSWIFLSEIITNLNIDDYDEEIPSQCGMCTLCINSCPTMAIVDEYTVDARLCISHNSIELKGKLPNTSKLFGWIYGCDICQDVCPYNKNDKPTSENLFYPEEEFFGKSYDELNEMSEEEFRKRFKNSSVKRIKYTGWKRNLNQFKSEKKNALI